MMILRSAQTGMLNASWVRDSKSALGKMIQPVTVEEDPRVNSHYKDPPVTVEEILH